MLIKVSNHVLSPTVAVVGTVGSAGVSHLCFEFDKSWDNLFRRVSFFPVQGGEPVTLLMTDECTVPVPVEIMAKSGEFDYVVSGVGEDDMLVSLVGKVKVLPTLTPLGAGSFGTPSEIAQIIAMMEAAKLAAQNAEGDASTAVETAIALKVAFNELLASMPSDLELSQLEAQIQTAQNVIAAAKAAAGGFSDTVEEALASIPNFDMVNALVTTVAEIQAALEGLPIDENFAEVSALAQTAYNRSLSVETALKQANAAIVELQNNPGGGREMLMGTYVGNGANSAAINIGRRWIGGMIFALSPDGSIDHNGLSFLSGPKELRFQGGQIISPTNDGFIVINRAGASTNLAGVTYRYIAF